MFEVIWLSAHEVLDSRGSPTLTVTVELFGGPLGRASVPAGISLTPREARELRDGDLDRYEGRGVQRAVASVLGDVARLLRGRQFIDLAELDEALVHLDGSRDKSRLGANALMGVSMAVARAVAESVGEPLWYLLKPEEVEVRMPVPHFSLISTSQVLPSKPACKEFMVAPIGAPTIAEAVRAGAEIRAALGRILSDRGTSVRFDDRGGLVPNIEETETILALLVEAIKVGGYAPGRDEVAIALNFGASGFYAEEKYQVLGEARSSDDMIDWYGRLAEEYPIWSIEDGLAEDDWQGWRRMTSRLGDRLQLVGGDIFVTSPEVILGGIAHYVANAALIKPTQVGTVTETLEAIRVCREAGWSQMISQRGGETEDAFIADLAVAVGCGQIKAGATVGGEHVAKYNRLIEIEADAQLPYGRAR